MTASEQILVLRRGTLHDSTCLGSELWADGEPKDWWPGDACVPVENCAWRMVVPLGTNRVPSEVDQSARYMLRAYQQGGPNMVSVFAFDLAGPLAPEPWRCWPAEPYGRTRDNAPESKFAAARAVGSSGRLTALRFSANIGLAPDRVALDACLPRKGRSTSIFARTQPAHHA